MSKTRTSIEALVRRNAAACEHACEKYCKCACRGLLHRKPHSEEWVKETVARFMGESPQLELEV